MKIFTLDNLTRMIMILLFIMIVWLSVSVASSSTKNSIINYEKYETVWVRVEGIGGFVGGTREIEIREELADYSKEKCVEGTNLFGRYIKK